jgi:hypothetical protein
MAFEIENISRARRRELFERRRRGLTPEGVAYLKARFVAEVGGLSRWQLLTDAQRMGLDPVEA